jgi:hypothetical protein
LEKESKELEEQEKNNKKQEEIIKSILSKKWTNELKKEVFLLDKENYEKLLNYYYQKSKNSHKTNAIISFFNSIRNIEISKYIFSKYWDDEVKMKKVFIDKANWSNSSLVEWLI